MSVTSKSEDGALASIVKLVNHTKKGVVSYEEWQCDNFMFKKSLLIVKWKALQI
jgi:hypothetical protein